MKTINWSVVLTVLAAIGGAVGTILTPIIGTSLATAIQAVLQALSGLLLTIPAIAAAVTAHKSALAKIELEKLAAISAAHGPGAVTAYLTGRAV